VSVGNEYPLVPFTAWSKGVAAELVPNTKRLVFGTPKITQLQEANKDYPAYNRILELDITKTFPHDAALNLEDSYIVLVGKVKSIHTTSFADDNKKYSINISVKSAKKDEPYSWFNCDVYGNLGSIVERYVTEGDVIGVKGSFGWRTYTNKQGVEAAVTRVMVRDIELMPKGGSLDEF
jgi:hypothetical protein